MNEPRSNSTDIVLALALLLFCQLLGEIVVQALKLAFPALAFPGPVIGMGILFLWLLWRGRPHLHLQDTADAILRNLSLLFVPAAVGIVQYGDVIAQFGVVLAVALVASTFVTLLVTVGVFLWVSKLVGGQGDDA